jgi:hypothetical protein
MRLHLPGDSGALVEYFQRQVLIIPSREQLDRAGRNIRGVVEQIEQGLSERAVYDDCDFM